MKRYGYLFAEIVSFDSLMRAARQAYRGKRNKSRVAAFYFNLENEVLDLQRELKSGIYKPLPLRNFVIREPKVRRIGAADFRDRVVHHAVCQIMEPLFERSYISHSYACRIGKGSHRAIRQAQQYCRQYGYFLKCDIKKYFESIDHRVLKEMLSRKFKDRDLLQLLAVIIDSSNDPGKGIPIGNLTSQHFANFYLDRVDHYVKDVLRVKGYLRYMDDFILFGRDKPGLHVLKAEISGFLHDRLKLQLKERATVISPCYAGLPFLGFHIFPGLIRVKSENKRRMSRKLETRGREFNRGIIDENKYAQSLRSISEHLKTANTHHFRRRIFDELYR